jgi:hypothetical protein
MTTAREAAQSIMDACNALDGVQAYTDPGANVSVPAVLIGMPELVFEVYTTAPTTATFTLYCAVKSDGYALDRLEPFVTDVVDAVESIPNAVITGCLPGSVSPGGTELPAYILTCEVSL